MHHPLRGRNHIVGHGDILDFFVLFWSLSLRHLELIKRLLICEPEDTRNFMLRKTIKPEWLLTILVPLLDFYFASSKSFKKGMSMSLHQHVSLDPFHLDFLVPSLHGNLFQLCDDSFLAEDVSSAHMVWTQTSINRDHISSHHSAVVA